MRPKAKTPLCPFSRHIVPLVTLPQQFKYLSVGSFCVEIGADLHAKLCTPVLWTTCTVEVHTKAVRGKIKMLLSGEICKDVKQCTQKHIIEVNSEFSYWILVNPLSIVSLCSCFFCVQCINTSQDKRKRTSLLQHTMFWGSKKFQLYFH